MRGIVARAALLVVIVGLAACSQFFNLGTPVRQGQSSSLVDFLYPDGQQPPPVDDVMPTLKLPLRVGLAFVPATRGGADVLSQALKSQLLEQVKAEFAKEKFLSEIVVIPDAYLAGKKGFDTLDSVARLYTLDVMALVSYDQVATSDDQKAAFLYWTIIGAYTIEATKNQVQTFVDTAVFDVPTRKLLFRAPGTDVMAAKATAIESNEELRKAQQESFRRAMANMTANLRTELVTFQERVKNNEGGVRVAQRNQNGGGGGAATGPLELTLLLLLVLAPAVRRLARQA